MKKMARWIVLGKPPDKQCIYTLDGIGSDLASSAEEAVKRYIEKTDNSCDQWQLNAVLFGNDVDKTKTDLRSAFIAFGVSMNELNDLIVRYVEKFKENTDRQIKIHQGVVH